MTVFVARTARLSSRQPSKDRPELVDTASRRTKRGGAGVGNDSGSLRIA